MYHRFFFSLGKGEIVGWKQWGLIEAALYRTFAGRKPRTKIVVRWEGAERETVSEVRDIRLTPDAKRIQQVVALFEKLGRKTEVRGARLVIEKKREIQS